MRYIIAAFLSIFATFAQAQAPTRICVQSGNNCVDVSSGAPFPVTASVSVGGFAPGLSFATLTATGSSASVALPTGTSVQFQNTGTTAVSCTLGVGSATATTNEIIIQASSTKVLVVGSNTFGACIDQSGSASNLVVLNGGAGLGTDSGGGGGSGSGGLSVTDQAAWTQASSSFTPTGGVFNDTATLSSGQQGTLRLTTKRAAIVDVDSTGNQLHTDLTSPIPTQDASVSVGGIGIVPTALAAGGIAPVVCGSAVSSCVLKASAGNLYSAYAECTAACWLMVFNSTTAPSNGATTAGVASGNMVECVDIAAGKSNFIAFTGMPPEVYSVGITAAISSTACATLTLSTVAFVKGSVK